MSEQTKYEFAVTEHFTTSHTYYVTATTRADAVEKVLANEVDYVDRNDIYPIRPITVRDAKRLRRATPPATDRAADGRGGSDG